MVPEDNFNQIMQLFWIDCDNELIQNTAIDVVKVLCNLILVYLVNIIYH